MISQDYLYRFRLGAWIALLAGFFYGIPERFIACLPDGFNAIEVGQLLTASTFLFFVCWLRPERIR